MLAWDSILIERVAYVILISYVVGFTVGVCIKMLIGGKNA